MDVAGRFYFEPEAGGLLLSPADEHPSEPVDAAAEMEDVAWSLDMLAETTTLDVRHVRRVVGRTCARSRPTGSPPSGGTPTLPASAGWSVRVAPGSRPRRRSPRSSAAIVGDAPWPAELAALGVGRRRAHRPRRFR